MGFSCKRGLVGARCLSNPECGSRWRNEEQLGHRAEDTHDGLVMVLDSATLRTNDN